MDIFECKCLVPCHEQNLFIISFYVCLQFFFSLSHRYVPAGIGERFTLRVEHQNIQVRTVFLSFELLIKISAEDCFFMMFENNKRFIIFHKGLIQTVSFIMIWNCYRKKTAKIIYCWTSHSRFVLFAININIVSCKKNEDHDHYFLWSPLKNK